MVVMGAVVMVVMCGVVMGVMGDGCGGGCSMVVVVMVRWLGGYDLDCGGGDGGVVVMVMMVGW